MTTSKPNPNASTDVSPERSAPLAAVSIDIGGKTYNADASLGSILRVEHAFELTAYEVYTRCAKTLGVNAADKSSDEAGKEAGEDAEKAKPSTLKLTDFSVSHAVKFIAAMVNLPVETVQAQVPPAKLMQTYVDLVSLYIKACNQLLFLDEDAPKDPTIGNPTSAASGQQ